MPAGQPKSPRVVIIKETDMGRAIEMKHRWLNKHYPGWQPLDVNYTRHNGRIYSKVVLRTSHGKQKTILFEMTAFWHQMAGTTVLFGQTGTLLRIPLSTQAR